MQNEIRINAEGALHHPRHAKANRPSPCCPRHRHRRCPPKGGRDG